MPGGPELCEESASGSPGRQGAGKEDSRSSGVVRRDQKRDFFFLRSLETGIAAFFSRSGSKRSVGTGEAVVQQARDAVGRTEPPSPALSPPVCWQRGLGRGAGGS